jgi:hypothetical protein
MSQQERFIVAGVDALTEVAKAICEPSGDPIGWRWMLLRYAAERAEYDAKCTMSAEDFQATKTAVLVGVTGLREASDEIAAQRREGADIINEALQPPAPPPSTLAAALRKVGGGLALFLIELSLTPGIFTAA